MPPIKLTNMENGWRVSTIVYQSTDLAGNPVNFETMVFPAPNVWVDEWCCRTATLEEMEAAHAEAIEMFKGKEPYKEEAE